jgi:hypothetical protein
MTPSRTLLQNLQRRLPMYLSEEVARVAGLHLGDLQQIIAGVLIPTAAQQDLLARRLQLLSYQYPETASAET